MMTTKKACSVCRWNKRYAEKATNYDSFASFFKHYTGWTRAPGARPHIPAQIESIMSACKKHEPEMAAAMLRVEGAEW